jgi:HTH-type transcriptional regulator, fmd operon transcriptional regulator
LKSEFSQILSDLRISVQTIANETGSGIARPGRGGSGNSAEGSCEKDVVLHTALLRFIEIIASSMPGKQEDVEKAPKDEIRSLITRRQAQILRLRSRGWTQMEVAEHLGTTRANISKLEQRANQNMEIAMRTINDWLMIHEPIIAFVPAGTGVLDVPAVVFRAADLEGVHIPVNSIDLAVRLKARAPHLFNRQTLPRDVEIFITRKGQVLVVCDRSRLAVWKSEQIDHFV